jgi:PAS domain S-box-containing protein
MSRTASADARFQHLFDASPDAILEVGPDGCILLVNAAAVRLFGYERQELVGASVDILVPERLRDKHAAARAQYLGQPQRRAIAGGREVQARRKDGSEFPAEASLIPLGCGQETVVTCIIRDVTARKLLEEQLAQSQRLEALGRLAGGVAHDFNNLLTIIGGYGQMALESVKAGHPLRQNVEPIVEAANQASALTRQLLTFSRRQIVKPRVIDLNRLIAKTSVMLKRVIGEDVELRLALHPRIWRTKADPGQMEQVLMNLAANARDAMPAGGWLAIATDNFEADGGEGLPARPPAGQYVLLSVGDSGSGLDAETRSHAFEPFFTTKGRSKGTGLGLSTVYGVVKQSGGEIWVDSEPGRGACFRIYLPRTTRTPKHARHEGRRRRPSRGTETILLVEDEPEVRKLVCEMLVRLGYQVLEACDGPEALALLQARGPVVDLLLTDVIMPQMSGPELAGHLAALRPGLKVLYMSGYPGEIIARRRVADTEAALPLLPKPFTRETLGWKIRQVLDAAFQRTAPVA